MQTRTQYRVSSYDAQPKGRKTLCRDFTPNDLVGIRLYQRGKDHFAVQYGMQVDDGLTYGQACDKLGQAIMHYLACEGHLDNREKGER